MICLCLCLCLCIRSRRLIVSSWTIGMIGSGFWQRVEQRWWLSNHRLMSRGVRCRCFHCQMMLHDCLGLPLVWHGAVECRRKKMLAVLVLVGRPSKATTKHTPNWLPVVNSACARRGCSIGAILLQCFQRRTYASTAHIHIHTHIHTN